MVINFIYMIIHKIFNVTDGHERNIGVDFVLLICHFYQKNLDSPNIFSYRC